MSEPFIIDGKGFAARVEAELKVKIDKLLSAGAKAPGLAVVLVGDNPASQVYVRSKSQRAKRCGIEITDVKLSADIGQEALSRELKALNDNPAIDGILLQLPLPVGLNEFEALLCISPEKDVDGLHPLNQGLLARSAPAHRPCTPLGCMKLIDFALESCAQSKDLSGLHAVVVGRSILVGKPIGLMLLERNCTVEFCHSRTRDLKASCKRGDILVAAVGKAEMLTADYVKPGAIVIDVGINTGADNKLCGDVEFRSVSRVASAITPVPGGVGPMTIAMLLSNTVDSAIKRQGL